MSTGDPACLFDALHHHVRFIGELLAVIVIDARSIAEINEVARVDYRLGWTSLDQVRRRIAWFKCLGVVEEHVTGQYLATDFGREVVEHLVLGKPEDIAVGDPVELDDVRTRIPVELMERVESMTVDDLRARTSAFGYVPTMHGDIDSAGAFEIILNACRDGVEKSGLAAFIQERFQTSESSASATMTTVMASGLVEEIALGIVGPTVGGWSFLETRDSLVLALIMHLNIRLSVELVTLLDEPRRAVELHRLAADVFGVDLSSSSGVSRRLHILRTAGLVIGDPSGRFVATALGRSVASLVPVEEPVSPGATAGEVADSAEGPVSGSSVIEDLVAAGTNSREPRLLELAVGDAFRELGFDAEVLGGAGNTDVLLRTRIGRDVVRLVVDAKAAAGGSVIESAISFDTLREHRDKYDAAGVIVVGPGFEIGRVADRAAKHSVRLVTTAELAEVLRKHRMCPAGTADYLLLFAADDASRRTFSVRYEAYQRRAEVFQHVVATLADEQVEEDEVTGGALTAAEVYVLMRGLVDPHPPMEEVAETLSFLAHPLIRAVEVETRDRQQAFRLADSAGVTMARLRALARSLADVSGS